MNRSIVQLRIFRTSKDNFYILQLWNLHIHWQAIT